MRQILFVVLLLAFFSVAAVCGSTSALADLKATEALSRPQPLDMKSFLDEPPEQFGGVGLTWGTHHDGFVVMNVLKKYPAERAGIQPGDALLMVDNYPIKSMSMDDVMKLIRGKPGTSVSLSILRGDAKEPLEFHMKRKDIVSAFLWSPRHSYEDDVKKLRPLAEDGNAEAQNALGVLYEAGLGVERNRQKAAVWYKKAATQGDVHAQYNLGRLYQTGTGVKQNYAESYFWASLAATSWGRPRGVADVLDEDEKHLNAEQKMVTGKRVAGWLNEHFPRRLIPPGPPSPFALP